MAVINEIVLAHFDDADIWDAKITVREEWNNEEDRNGCQARIVLSINYKEIGMAEVNAGPIEMTTDEIETLIQSLRLVQKSVCRNNKPYPETAL